MFENLLACAGNWQGINRVTVDPTAGADESETTLHVVPILHGLFLRINQKWEAEGIQQEGSMLIGRTDEANSISLHWIDTWHNGTRIMACAGKISEDGTVNVLGSWPCPPGPDWGWRIIIKPLSPDRLEIVMFNIHPNGQEDLGVEIFLSRV